MAAAYPIVMHVVPVGQASPGWHACRTPPIVDAQLEPLWQLATSMFPLVSMQHTPPGQFALPAHR
jgi:hypothetical protein